jgi:hypothetical protein
MLLADSAVTPSSPTSSGRGVGAGTGTIFQLWPSQCSTSGTTNSSPLLPTAHALLAESATTPDSALNLSGFGLVTTCHALPVQCSMSVALPPPGGLREPTAQPSSAARILTPFSRPVPSSGKRRQVPPLKNAASGVPADVVPTAQMCFADSADTAASRPGTPSRVGAPTAFQPLPVWCVMSGRGEPSGRIVSPTDQKLFGPTEVTPKSTALPPGFGLATTRQPSGTGAASASGVTAAAKRIPEPMSATLVLTRMTVPQVHGPMART